MKDTAVTIPPMTPRATFMKIARLANEMGYHSIWTYEEFVADPMVRLAECLADTRLKAGTGCLNPFLRTPLAIAMTYMSVEEMLTRESLAEQIKAEVDLLGLDLPVISMCAHNDRQILEALDSGRIYAEQG